MKMWTSRSEGTPTRAQKRAAAKAHARDVQKRRPRYGAPLRTLARKKADVLKEMRQHLGVK